MSFILEFVLSAWIELAFIVVPKEKIELRRMRSICKFAVLSAISYAIIAFTSGAIMISNQTGSFAFAIFLITSSAMIVVFQIIVGIIFKIKETKRSL